MQKGFQKRSGLLGFVLAPAAMAVAPISAQAACEFLMPIGGNGSGPKPEIVKKKVERPKVLLGKVVVERRHKIQRNNPGKPNFHHGAPNAKSALQISALEQREQKEISLRTEHAEPWDPKVEEKPNKFELETQ